MRRIVFLIGLFLAVSAQAQLRSQTELKQIDVKESITSPGGGSLFNFLSADRFSMNQSYALSFYSGGGQSGSLGMFTNTFNFKLSNPLMLRVDMGIMHQPFGGPKTGLQNQNAHFMHGAELIYRPSDHFMMQVGYRNNPYYSNAGFYENPFARGTNGSFNDYRVDGKK